MTTPSQRLARALNEYDEETKELRAAARAETGWTIPDGRCWWNGCASSHPDLDGPLTEALNLDDGTVGAIDGLAVTPEKGRWVVLGEASDYLEE